MTIAAPKVAFTYETITLHDLRAAAREVGAKPALVQGDRSLSFSSWMPERIALRAR